MLISCKLVWSQSLELPYVDGLHDVDHRFLNLPFSLVPLTYTCKKTYGLWRSLFVRAHDRNTQVCSVLDSFARDSIDFQ